MDNFHKQGSHFGVSSIFTVPAPYLLVLRPSRKLDQVADENYSGSQQQVASKYGKIYALLLLKLEPWSNGSKGPVPQPVYVCRIFVIPTDPEIRGNKS